MQPIDTVGDLFASLWIEKDKFIMENFHLDILENILSRLPTGPALHAKRVCTTWREILRKKTEKSGFLFSSSHSECGRIRKQLFYEDEYDHSDHAKINNYHSDKTLSKIEHGRSITKSWRDIMIGSCNGLVCFGKDGDITTAIGFVPFLICNPLTGESVFLPEYDNSELPRDISIQNLRHGSVSSGFGYSNSTNSYKVVIIYYHDKERKGHVQVYTVGSRKWRYIGCISRYSQYTFDFDSAVYANGALHWCRNEIVVFNLESEIFSYITLPWSYHPPLKLLGANNNLYLVTGCRTPRTDIWVYKKNKIPKEYNQDLQDRSKSSSPWIKELSIESGELYEYITPFTVTRNNQVLLWLRHYNIGIKLYCYDPNTSTIHNLWDLNEVKGMRYTYTQGIPHIHSLLSLKDLGETNIISLKVLEELMLQVNSNGFCEKVDQKVLKD